MECPGPAEAEGLGAGGAGAAWACRLVCLAALAALFLMVVLTRAPLWHDEVWYLSSVGPLRRGGLTVDFLRGLPGPAGPLYACVHALGEPLTRLRPPAVRLLNMGLFVLALGPLGWVAGRRGVARPWSAALGLTAAPVMHGVVGTAITEVPALLFFCLHLAFLVESTRDHSPARRVALAVAAGLCFGLAFAGRQQYLMALAATPVLGWGRRDLWTALAVYLAAALVIPAGLVIAWRGMSPPATAYVGSGVSVPNGLMAFAYAGLIYAIYDVRSLLVNWRAGLAIIAAVSLANVALGTLEHFPLQELAKRYVPAGLLTPFARLTSGVMMGFGVLLMVTLARMVADRAGRGDRFFLYMVIASVLMISVSAKVVHLFAGRYVIQALPLLVLIAAGRSPDTYGKALRMALGAAAGLLSASAYLGLTL